ncbi:glycosyltransferase [Litorihabitans aurantiacus]|uniref:Glycosyl transferase n=1 Tax=Litorihabitans aurantiacus TaxID=1930061 RepID=A0AA37XH17_9MICO|nr:glycosyltransferase [Litorihabitans aurantiacus]GMA32916.1 glycosyl transferase [Litorihabitans aurantiacus]
MPEGRGRALVVPGGLPGPSGGSAYDRRVLEELRAAGLEVGEERIPGRWPTPGPADRDELRRALARHDDVVVDGLIASAAPDELAAARASGTRVTVLVHLPLALEGGRAGAGAGSGSGPGAGDDALALAAAERRALVGADAVVATSRWTREDLAVRHGLTRVAVATPGVDPARLARGSRPPRLLVLGALTPRKNAVAALEALAALEAPGARPATRFSALVVGPEGADPAYASAVRGTAARLGPHVEVLGPRTGEELDAVWDGCDLLVLPSLAETYGMVVTEALARGVPAVVAAGTGAVEALRGDGVRADLPLPGAAVDVTDGASLAAVLERWLADATLRAEWSRAARRHREHLSGWDATAVRIREAIGW